MQILTENTITQTTNRLLELIYEVDAGVEELSPRHTINFDFSEEAAVAEDGDALTDLSNEKLLGGTMSSPMYQSIASYINELPQTEIQSRVKGAVFFVVSSPQFAVQR